MERFTASLAICVGNSPVPGEFPTQRPVTRSFDVYFDLRRNKRLSKQSWGWWFETPSCPLWCHRNARHRTMWTIYDNFHQGKLEFSLTHWGRVTHICVGNLTIIGSDNGLSPGRRQAIIWTNAGISLIGPSGTNFSEILIEILTFSFKKMCLKVSSAKWRPFCLGLNVLNHQSVLTPPCTNLRRVCQISICCLKWHPPQLWLYLRESYHRVPRWQVIVSHFSPGWYLEIYRDLHICSYCQTGQ